MPLYNIPTFETGEFPRSGVNRRLPDKEYGLALDCLVKATSDMLLTTTDGKVLLGKRCVEPQPDWWFTGGRMGPGETPIESCKRILRREAKLENLSDDSFHHVGTYGMIWAMREQPPKENGTCDVTVVFSVLVDESILVDVKSRMDPAEYSDAKLIHATEVADDESYHPVLRQACLDYLSAQVYKELESAVKNKQSDEVIAKLSRKLVEMQRVVSGGR